MATSTARRPALIPTRPADSLAWMGPDLRLRLLPLGGAVLIVWLGGGRPSWLGLAAGRLDVQLAAGLGGGAALFLAAGLVQLALSGARGALRVPASGGDAALQGAYFALNAPVEEAFFRGLLQGGLTALLGPPVGLLAGTAGYVLYHRLGGWAWLDVAATALAGVPLALAFWLLPGPASLLGVSVAHVGATCGFLGPGPWLLRRLRLL
jgi:membrane protease YdiL (CAAX protease family)